MRGSCMELKQLYALIGGLRLRQKLEVCVFVVRIVAAGLQQNALRFWGKVRYGNGVPAVWCVRLHACRLVVAEVYLDA